MNNELDKNRVISNFSRATATYCGHAKVQKRVASHLAEVIKKHSNCRDLPKPFLEIGAGTGFLTEKILEIGLSSGLITDIAPSMVEKLKDGFSGFSNISVKRLDGEDFKLGQQFNSIVSSSVFQWFSGLEKPFANIHNHLKHGGVFAFSMFIDGTLRELRDISGSLGIPFPGQNYFSSSEVLESLEKTGFNVHHYKMLDYTVYFRDSLTFLKNIKSVGAVNATENRLSTKQLRHIIKCYDEKYASPAGVKATYTTMFIYSVKPD